MHWRLKVTGGPKKNRTYWQDCIFCIWLVKQSDVNNTYVCIHVLINCANSLAKRSNVKIRRKSASRNSIFSSRTSHCKVAYIFLISHWCHCLLQYFPVTSPLAQQHCFVVIKFYVLRTARSRTLDVCLRLFLDLSCTRVHTHATLKFNVCTWTLSRFLIFATHKRILIGTGTRVIFSQKVFTRWNSA